MALVSTGALAAKPIKPQPAPDLTPQVEALEADVAKIGVPYTVYDQTGRAVGTTKDGLGVHAQIEGIEGITYYIRAGKELGPNSYTYLVFEESDCAGQRYIQTSYNGDRMDGVVYGEGVHTNPEGEYIIPDPYLEPISITAVSLLGHNNSTGVWDCSNLSPGLVPGQVSLPLVVNIDWVTPLTITPPQ